ncbi:FkbM family methyltransferase [Luteimonas soli]|uniref:FkbM family methyltransferase n=1 Tax=Luteimonas soli TaxID=1648966 RepID=A0ABV7XH82_9GAMM
MGSRSIFIAGNGPSLKELDFSWLQDTDWLGMNAAYRHWDRIDVYPTLYCCLDKVVVKSHAEQILRLHAEGKVQRFFLVKDVLEALPDFPQDDRVFFLEDLVASDAPGTEIFKTAFSDKKTTGSWAVRFAIYLGYRDITLGGIDCNYVEVISQAERTGVGLELKIGSEVNENPNYFFDDYQKQGDTYQVPNPARHFGNLHLQSFEALCVDIAKLGLDVRIRNTALHSRLHRFGVFEYVPLREALGVPALQALAIPLTTRELPLLLANLALWALPAFRPLRPDSTLCGKIDLRLFFDTGPSDEIVEEVEAAWAGLHELRECFRRLEITFLGIPDDLNQYVRDPKRRDVPRKMGPNLHFLATMRECRGYRFTQLMETDCVPAKADWLTDLDAICRREPFWIAGAFLQELGSVNASFAAHINGNALYATGDPAFQEFMEKTFIPALRYLIIERGDNDLAYDCLISKLWVESATVKGLADDVLKQHATTIQRNLDKFRPTAAFQNISHGDDALDEWELLALLEGGSVLIHSKRLATLLGTACARAPDDPEFQRSGVLSRRFVDTFLKISAGTIHAFHCYSNLQGCSVERFDRARGRVRLNLEEGVEPPAAQDRGVFMVFAVYEPTAGRQLACRVSLRSSTAQRVVVKFARQGEGAFVEESSEIELQPGLVSSLRLSLDCKDDYRQVRLFVAPLRAGPAVLQMMGEVADAAVDEASSGVSTSRGSAELGDLFNSFRKRAPAGSLVPLFDSRTQGLPRLLMVDSTPLGHISATGQLKKTFLEGWPDAAFLQVWLDGESLHLLHARQDIGRSRGVSYDVDEIVRRCIKFQPDVVYFRPIDSSRLFSVVESLLERIQRPLVIHMMDDWPARLEASDPERFAQIDGALRALVGRSQRLLSISGAMSVAYRERYGGEWLPLANGSDPSRFPARKAGARARDEPFVIRYMGALADDMTYASVCDVAHAVAELAERYPVRLEIHTMHWCREKAERDLASLRGVRVQGLVAQDEYERTLSEADALLIAYNFDPASIGYIGYSLANKMPECLASGVPLIAYGPRGVATIDYLEAAGVAVTVTEKDRSILSGAIEQLVVDPERGHALARAARRHVDEYLSRSRVQERFRKTMREAWALGPFARATAAHYDETDCVSELFDHTLSGTVMIDVGAHHGHALFPFLQKGWQVFAFEPDDGNRAILEKRLEKDERAKSLVRLDKRAVSDHVSAGLAYYRSDQSSGISGLSAFHPSHVSKQTVDTTTLSEALAEEDIPGVDFLKVDTEGHDLFVLKGFPWHRFKPAVIECEFEDAKTVPLGYTFHDMAGFLLEQGYCVYVSEWHPIIRYGIRHDWHRLMPYPCELSDQGAWGNLLAFRDPVDESLLANTIGKLIKVAEPATGPERDSLVLASDRRYRLVADPAFRRLSSKIWRYHHEPGGPRQHWMAIVDAPGETAGRTFGAGIRLRASVPMAIMVSLGRLGSAEYEGTSVRVQLEARQPRHVRFTTGFRAAHTALKLQVYVEGMAPFREGDMLVDSVCVAEIPEELAGDFSDGKLDLRAANRLFREGKYAKATAVYEFLFGQNPLRIYRDNARTAEVHRDADSPEFEDDRIKEALEE